MDQLNTETEASGPAINALRELPYTTRSFEAGGHTYYVEESLSIERYKAFQRMEIELGFGYNFSGLHEKIQTAFQKQNESKFAEVSVLLYQIMEGAVSVAEKKPISLYVASLFVNRAEEDRTAWSRTLAEEKLKDWRDIETNFFFVLAMSRVRDFKESMKSISQTLAAVADLAAQEESGDLTPSAID